MMRLDALKFVERGQIGVVIVQVNHEADRDEVFAIVVEEQAAARIVLQRPAHGVLNQALLVLGRIDLPDFLQTDAEFRRLAVLVEAEFRDQLLGKAAARAFGKQRVFAEQLHAAGIGILVRAVLGDAHVAGGDAPHRALVVIEHFGSRKARIDLDAERFRLRRQPAADVAERADVAVVVVHQRRHDEVRQPERADLGEPVEAIVLDLGRERAVRILTPVRDQLVQRDRIDHRTRQDVRADFGTLFDHDHAEIGIELLEPDGRGKAGRAGADDHDVEFHGFARG
jgi:hypothetical protein